MAAKHNIFRDERVHVMSEMCATCVFRPGNQMHLVPGRVEGMIAEAQRDESAIICHNTLYTKPKRNAVCRGFYLHHPTAPLQIAGRLGLIVEDDLRQHDEIQPRERRQQMATAVRQLRESPADRQARINTGAKQAVKTAERDKQRAINNAAEAAAARLSPLGYSKCRSFGHAWDEVESDTKPLHGFYLRMRCMRCPTEKHAVVNVFGELESKWAYDYPEDYADQDGWTRSQWRLQYIAFYRLKQKQSGG